MTGKRRPHLSADIIVRHYQEKSFITAQITSDVDAKDDWNVRISNLVTTPDGTDI